MDDESKKPVNSEAIPAAHIVKGEATSISTDGTRGMLVFTIEDGSRFAVTVDVGGIAAVQSMVADLARQARSRQLGIGNVPLRYPKEFAVGSAPEIRNHVAVRFDPDGEIEEMFMLPDTMAQALAAMIEKNVLSRMSMADRRAALAAKSPGLVLPGLPGGKKIILPGH